MLGLLHQLVQKPSGRLPLEVHVLVANNPANLCGQTGERKQTELVIATDFVLTGHPELLAEGGQANTHGGEEKESSYKRDQVSVID